MKLYNHVFPNYNSEEEVFLHRMLVAFFGILTLSSVLISHIYFLQVLNFEYYNTLSDENRIRLAPLLPLRGFIFDRYGIPVATNRMMYTVEVVPAEVPNVKNMLKKIRSILNLTDHDIKTFKNRLQYSRIFTSIPLKIGLTDIQVAKFAVNQYLFPGVKLTSHPYRYYPYHQTMTHVIGYVAKVNHRDAITFKKYRHSHNYISEDVGKLGIENYYEHILHGTVGYKEIEVSNVGRVIRTLNEYPAKSGYDIYLSIDVKLQRYIESLLLGNRAAVVVTDPRNGEILALVSTPTYDANVFIQGMTNHAYKILSHDKHHPLYNRALQAAYPPASTVKPYIAVSALSIGIIDRNTTLFDPGWWQLPGSKKRYHDWKKYGHGTVDVTKSLEESSDTFFYQIAYEMGIQQLYTWMKKFGYGSRTGIDLPQESAGNIPNREWKLKKFKEKWYQGDTISVGIGQGYWTATPLQMNNAMMILINEGVIKTPHLLLRICKEKEMIAYSSKRPVKMIKNINPNYWKIVKNGMYGVANYKNGTAHQYFSSSKYKIAAKSGTAQVFSAYKNKIYKLNTIKQKLRNHKLMTAFAPYNNPRIAVTIILENGGHNLSIGNIVRKILDYLILHKHNNIK